MGAWHTSLWMPGNQVVVQPPARYAKTWFEGAGVTFTMNGGPDTSWFQCPVVTPTRLLDNHAVPYQFMLLFRAAPSVTINRLDLWHGPDMVMSVDVVYGGDQSHQLTADNTWVIPQGGQVDLSWGLNVSVRVQPGNGGDITFVSYGCDFYSWDD
jgi:hypothetical protein